MLLPTQMWMNMTSSVILMMIPFLVVCLWTRVLKETHMHTRTPTRHTTHPPTPLALASWKTIQKARIVEEFQRSQAVSLRRQRAVRLVYSRHTMVFLKSGSGTVRIIRAHQKRKARRDLKNPWHITTILNNTGLWNNEENQGERNLFIWIVTGF